MKIKDGEIEINRTKIYVHLRIVDLEDVDDELKSVFGGTSIVLTVNEAEKVVEDLQKQIQSLKGELI